METDELDGEPVWAFESGEPIDDDTLAWEHLGTGHRCETWLAWSRSLLAPVVVKLARPHQIDHPRARRSLAREIGLLRTVSHPGFARSHADRVDSSRPLIVMEYLDGPDLSDVIADGPLEADEVVRLGSQILAAVHQLHRAGFAHIDLKPQNIVLRDGRPYVIDLASARRLGHEQAAGAPPIGSAGYAAPELEDGLPITLKTDLYGVGAILFESLLGEPAFDPDDAARDRPDPMIDAGARMPPGLRATIGALLAPDPRDRPASAAVVWSMLTAAAGSDSDPAWPPFAYADATTALRRAVVGSELLAHG